MLGKAVRVDGGRGDDDLQVGALGQDFLQITQQEINVQTSLMGLIDDDRVIGIQQGVALGLGQQNTIGHEFDRGLGTELVVEPDLVAHHIAQGGVQFLGNALGHRGRSNSSGLCVADPTWLAALGRIHSTAPKRQGHLGQLRGLARARFTRDNHHLVLLDGFHDLISSHGDGQRRREFDVERSVCQKKAKISSQWSIISAASPKSKASVSDKPTHLM